MARFAGRGPGNVHRGVHALAERASAAYEGARATAQRFLERRHAEEIVFVRGATEAINLVARTFGQRAASGAGDEVLVTDHGAPLEHRALADAVRGEGRPPARRARRPTRASCRSTALERLIGPRTRLVAVTHVSNAIGTINPVRGHRRAGPRPRRPVLVDGAQAAAHLPIDVQALGCDFYVLSGHKCYGPTGIGVLYGRQRTARARCRPSWAAATWSASVTFEQHHLRRPRPTASRPARPTSEGAIGLAAAIDYLDGARIATPSPPTSRTCWPTRPSGLEAVPGLRLVGTARAGKAAIVSFVLDGRARPRRRDHRSTGRAWPSAPGTTAPSRCWTASAWPPPPAPRWRSTTPARTSTPSCGALATVKEVFR